jgi:LIVCS family branched-chain amino acid:cation transporter
VRFFFAFKFLENEMKQTLFIISIGFALFSMFFGSGNLVFPIMVGQESEGNFLIAATGISITGVLVPFLGVLGMVLFDGDLNAFFRPLGRYGPLIFSIIGLGLLGPFGVVARCLTVSHGALELIFPQLSLPLCSFLLVVIIFILTIRKNRIVSLLGTILTPLLLLSIALIAIFGLSQGPQTAFETSDLWPALKNGIFQGYQTMDLLAGFFFSRFIINHVRHRLREQGKESLLIQTILKASLIGMTLLTTIYFIFAALGSFYSPILEGQPPQEMLGLITLASLGPIAVPCVCVTIVFACLTTAMVLGSLFAELLHNEIFCGKINSTACLLITLAISFGVSTLDFQGISRFLGPIVEMIYPALIVLTIGNIAVKSWKLAFR